MDSDFEPFLKPNFPRQKLPNKQFFTRVTTLKCYIVLPCYNEAENLERLIKSIDETLHKELFYKIIAIDDGSIDNTKEILKKLSLTYPIRVIRHPKNRGLAEALKTGFKIVLEEIEDEDFVIFMDSDNTHDPRYIPSMVNLAKSFNFDIIVGSRYTENGKQVNVPPLRILMSKTINYLIGFLLRLNIKDFTSGYRCFKASTIKRLHEVFGENIIESKGFEVSFEVLLKALACNFKVGEVPITLNYSLKNGQSKMQLIPTVLRYLHFMLGLKSKLRNIHEKNMFSQD